MGVVYAAHDDRLDRPVAIKVIRAETLADAAVRARFQREARVAASVSHPHICPLYEFDEDQGQPFLVMELLEGEPLSARLARSPLPPGEAFALADAVLDALAALHRRGIVHRDLKPANIFLTPHGPKLLDFGLAQPLADGDRTHEQLTMPGRVAGTPRYMAPEQLFEGRADQRSDVFAAGAVIYEMLSGRPAFEGRTLAAIIDAVTRAEPRPIDGSAGPRIDAVLRQAMAKDPAARIPRADTLAALLRDARTNLSGVWTPPASEARSPARFAALPLRVLRPDPDTDFLAFSVPDAVSIALAHLESVVVRATPLHAGADIDVRDVGRDLGVDLVLIGTILRAGHHVRVSAQLADAAAGSILWSDIAQAPIDDLFQLQDALTTRIVSSLKLPLSASDRRALDRQAPANAEAYELYLRANELALDPARWNEARELYHQSLAIDPRYAPAWARLGRTLRLLAKWAGEAGRGLMSQAEAAFTRAFEIDPDLSIAHEQATYVDVELGRATRAMERLLVHAGRHRADAAVFAGLVTTCRYSGLLDASRQAHARVAALDPRQATSIAWTYFLGGDYDRAIAEDRGMPPYCSLLARALTGRLAMDELEAYEDQTPHAAARMAIRAYRFAFSDAPDAAIRELDALRSSGFDDPEGWYLYALCLSRHSEAHAAALSLLTRAIDGGYACSEALRTHPQWESLRRDAVFAQLTARADALAAHARQRFTALDGESLLAAPTTPDR
jgi:TolB-like protein